MFKTILKIFLLFFLLCLFSSCSSILNKHNEVLDDHYPANAVIGFYKNCLNGLASVRAGMCPMYPSCSKYSQNSITKNGIFMGWIMTTDRLMRCGRDEIKFSKMIYVDGVWKHYDSVKHNDFWWNTGSLGFRNK